MSNAYLPLYLATSVKRGKVIQKWMSRPASALTTYTTKAVAPARFALVVCAPSPAHAVGHMMVLVAGSVMSRSPMDRRGGKSIAIARKRRSIVFRTCSDQLVRVTQRKGHGGR